MGSANAAVFPGSRLSDAQNIAAFQQQGNGLGLDRRRFEVIFALESTEKRLGQAEFDETVNCQLIELPYCTWRRASI